MNAVALSIVTRIVVMFAGVVTSVITARALGVEGRGEYFHAVTLANLAVQFAHFGLASSNTYEVARDSSLLGPLAANSLWVSMLLGGLAGLLIALTLSGSAGSDGSKSIWFVAIMAPLLLYGLLASNLTIGLSKITAYNYYQLGSTAFQLLALLIAYRLKLEVAGFLAVSALTALLSMGGLLVMLRSYGATLWAPNLELLRAGVGYALRAYVITLLGFAMSRLLVLVASSQFDAVVVGLYSVAIQFADVLAIVPVTVSMVLFPRLVNAHPRDRYLRMREVLWRVFLLMLALAGLTALLAPMMISVLFGKDFSPSAMLLLLMLPGVLGLSIVNIISQFLSAEGVPLSGIAAWGLALVAFALLAWLLLDELGMAALAVAQSAAYLLLATTMYFISKQRSVRQVHMLASRS